MKNPLSNKNKNEVEEKLVEPLKVEKIVVESKGKNLHLKTKIIIKVAFEIESWKWTHINDKLGKFFVVL